MACTVEDSFQRRVGTLTKHSRFMSPSFQGKLQRFNQSNTSPLALHAPGGPSFVLQLACYWETLKNLVKYL